MTDKSAVLTYYVRKIITRVTSTKISEIRDGRARRARRQAKQDPDPAHHGKSGS